jgi:hypothetical protein
VWNTTVAMNRKRLHYVVQYSDGDRKDLNEDELSSACELSLQIQLDMEDDEVVHSGTDEDESYRPSPKVIFLFN